MKRTIVALLAGTMASFAAQPVAAQERQGDDRKISVGITAGTLGIGPELGYRINGTIGLRGNVTFLSGAHHVRSGGIDYRGHIELASGGAQIDLYPFGGGFFLSGGARYNGNNGELRAMPTTNQQIGDISYTPAQIGTITGYGDVDDFSPLMTLGYRGTIGRRFGIGIEAGAMYQGSVRITHYTSNGTLADQPEYRTQLENERAQLQGQIDGYKVYPVVQLNLGYRF